MAIKDGLIDINQPVKAYLPNFEGSAYGEDLVKHLLQMSILLELLLYSMTVFHLLCHIYQLYLFPQVST